jgi:hypothetical protein
MHDRMYPHSIMLSLTDKLMDYWLRKVLVSCLQMLPFMSEALVNRPLWSPIKDLESHLRILSLVISY